VFIWGSKRPSAFGISPKERLKKEKIVEVDSFSALKGRQAIAQCEALCNK